MIALIGCSNESSNDSKLIEKKFGAWSEEWESYGFELELKHLESWHELVNYVNSISCNGYRPKLTLHTKAAIKTVFFFNSCMEGFEYINIKQRNTIQIHNDSILKAGMGVYPFDSIEPFLRRDIENEGKDHLLSESPDKLIIFFSQDKLDINNFYKMLDQLTEAFENITNNTDIVIELNKKKGFPNVPPMPPF